MKYKDLKLKKMKFFYIAWVMMVFHFCVANSNLMNYNTSIVSYLSMALFCGKIIVEMNYTKKEILKIMLLLLWGCLSYRATDDMRVLWFCLVLSASKGINFSKTVKLSFLTMLICCFLFMICYFLGVSEETCITTSRGIRHGLGLGHPNMCSAYYMLLVSQYMYINYEVLNKKEILLTALGSFFVFLITKSITGLVTILFALVIVYVLKYMPNKKRNSIIVVSILFIGIFIITLFPIIYNEHFTFLNTIMTGRLKQANYYYIKYGVSLFGNNVNVDLNPAVSGNILDIGYAKMMFNNGLLYYIFVTLGYAIILLGAIKKGKSPIIILISCYVIYMYTENVATYIFMNVSMLLFSRFLFDRKAKEGGNVKTWKKRFQKLYIIVGSAVTRCRNLLKSA